MGFDLHGINPKINTKKPQILNRDWGEISEDEYSEYFDARRQYNAENKGLHFRNNVWFWRPLWDYVCVVCDEVLSTADKDGGCHNSGHTISKEKADKMYELLSIELLMDGHLEEEIRYNDHMEKLPLETCKICDGLGCQVCDGSGKRKAFLTNYPFSSENVVNFVEFLRECGGFTIE